MRPAGATRSFWTESGPVALLTARQGLQQLSLCALVSAALISAGLSVSRIVRREEKLGRPKISVAEATITALVLKPDEAARHVLSVRTTKITSASHEHEAIIWATCHWLLAADANTA